MYNNSSLVIKFVDVHFSLEVIVIYACLAIIGLIGNTATCIVIISNKSMHTATNCYLFNLAISDMMLLFWDFPMYTTLYSEYLIFCKLRFQAFITAIHVSIMIVTCFSIERYLAICHPFQVSNSNDISISRALKVIFWIWFFGFLLTLPQTYYIGLVPRKDDPTRFKCIFNHSVGLWLNELISKCFFLIPMPLIFVMYARIGREIKRSCAIISKHTNRPKQRVPKLLVAVTLAFFICWLPGHIQRLAMMLSYYRLLPKFLDQIAWSELYFVSHFVFYASAWINPIIYNIMSKKFRDAFKVTILSCCSNSIASSSSSNLKKTNTKETPGMIVNQSEMIKDLEA